MRISRERNRRSVPAGACLISLTPILTKKKSALTSTFSRFFFAENFSEDAEFQFVSARRAPLNKRHAFSENFPAVAERAFLRGMRRRRARGAARDGDGGDVPAV